MFMRIRLVYSCGASQVATLFTASSLLLLACSANQPDVERLSSSREALTQADAGQPAMITISGTVTDPIDGPQAGITITLSGSAQGQVATSFSGAYNFSVKPGGSCVSASGQFRQS